MSSTVGRVRQRSYLAWPRRNKRMERAVFTIEDQIAALGERMDKGLDEIKVMISKFDVRIRELETSEARYHPLMESRVAGAWKEIEKHAADLILLKSWSNEQAKVIGRLEGVGKWLMGVLTALVIAVLVGLVTGRMRIDVLR